MLMRDVLCYILSAVHVHLCKYFIYVMYYILLLHIECCKYFYMRDVL